MTIARFLFDSQLTGPGSALAHVYQTKTVKYASGLGQLADDAKVLKWCAAHGYVLVTKDWGIYTEPDLAELVRDLGVSIVWIRHSTGNIGARDLFYVLARDLRWVEDEIARAGGSQRLFSLRLTGRRVIRAPTSRARRPGRPRKAARAR